jgi:ubiquinone/menaquinone biosynthesis C-methylase UbiE
MPERVHRPLHERWLFEGRGSRVYDWWSGLVGRRLYRRVAADVAASAPADAAILDVGAGTGRLLVELARRRDDLSLSGVDLSPDMVSVAKTNARRAGFADRIALLVGDVTNPPYPDRSFDLIVSTLSMHHWPDPTAATAELARVLRPGGSIWIYDFRFVSDRELVTAAQAQPALGGRPVERTVVRPGLLPLYVRLTMSKPSSPDQPGRSGDH